MEKQTEQPNYLRDRKRINLSGNYVSVGNTAFSRPCSIERFEQEILAFVEGVKDQTSSINPDSFTVSISGHDLAAGRVLVLHHKWETEEEFNKRMKTREKRKLAAKKATEARLESIKRSKEARIRQLQQELDKLNKKRKEKVSLVL